MAANLLVRCGHELVTTSMADHDDAPVSLTWSAEHNGYGYFSPSAGWITVPEERLVVFGVNMPVMLARMMVRMDVSSRAGPVALAPNLLWEIGDVRFGGRRQSVPVWFARRLQEPSVWQHLRDAVRSFCSLAHGCADLALKSAFSVIVTRPTVSALRCFQTSSSGSRSGKNVQLLMDRLIESICALFKSSDLEAQSVDLNGIALGALEVLRGELKDHGVITHTELAPDLPLVPGQSGQLQEVMLNLFRNAIDAMDSITDRARVLRVRTERNGCEAVVVSVEDSGPGIDFGKIGQDI